MSPSVAEEDKGTRGKVRAVLGVLLGVGIWVTTWVFPLTFMIMMAWGCETHARQLGRRTLLYYDGEADNILEAIKTRRSATRPRSRQTGDRPHASPCSSRSRSRSRLSRYVDHVRNTVGINWLGALGALVALSLVIATAVISSRK